MTRREFITLLGGAATWPLVAHAQQQNPLIGYLFGGGPQPPPESLAAFYQGLNEQGYVQGRNIDVQFRGSDDARQIPDLAAAIVRLPVSAIVTTGTVNAALAAKAATATIPIIFGNGSDPVRMGLVASMNRPGGNLTGVSYYSAPLLGKRLELLCELVPGAATVAFLVNPTSGRAKEDREDLEEAAASVGQKLVTVHARNEQEIDAAFARLARLPPSALLVASDAYFTIQRRQITALASRHRIPTTYGSRDYVVDGGLMSYGDNRRESYRQVGRYTGRILKGEKPADLPVLQPTKFEFVINLQTARALGLTFPPSFHLRADEVIE